jgi:hypothetical protein
MRINQNNANSVTPRFLSGFLGVSRGQSSTIVMRSQSTTSTASVSSTAPNSLSTFVFARNLDGFPNIHINARLSFYSIGESLDLALLDARVTALMNALVAAIP